MGKKNKKRNIKDIGKKKQTQIETKVNESNSESTSIDINLNYINPNEIDINEYINM